MSVELDPPELTFKRPFTREVVQKLFIRNPNYEPVAFKVKTTAPKQYCVRPNSGRIEAGKEVEVQVLLQSMKEDPPLDYKCRDKFLVQSVSIGADQEVANVSQIWTDVERTNKQAIQEKKIRVQYLASDDDTQSNDTQSSPPSYSSNADIHGDAPVGPVSVLDSRPEGAVSSREAADEAYNPVTGKDHTINNAGTKSTTTSSGVLNNAAQAVSDASSSLSDQLAEAKVQIATLTAQLADPNSELRQRKVGDIAADAKDKVVAGVTNIGRTSQAPEGVPVQIAAALCLLAFLLAYFFF